jgi:hypothetical protein
MTPPKEAAELAAEGTLDHGIEVLVLDGRTLLRAVDTAASGPPLRWLVAALELPPGRVANAADRQTIRHQFGLSLLYHADMEEALIALSALLGADLGGHDGIAPFSVTALAQASRDWLLDLHRQPTAGEKQADPRAQAIRDTFRAFQELDTRYGGGHARLALVQYLTTNVLPLLHSGNRGMQGAGAELLYLAGLMAFDDGALGLAERYLIQALRFAQEAGDRAFAANTVAAMSHLAVFAGHGEEASRLARAGLVGLSESEDPAVRMRLLTMEARGHALMGDSPGCAADLSGAETALEEAGSDSEPGWARFLDLAFLAGEMSQCFSDLQQEKLAERFALESIQASNGRGRRRVLSQTTLATSYLRQGKLEQACIAGGQALDLVAGGIRSTRAAYEIRSLAGALEAHGTHPEARAFRDRAREQFS